MPRPCCRVRRIPPPPPAAVVHEILQWRPHTSLLGEGCAVLAYRRTGRADSLPPNSRRAAPPICPHLIFDRHSRYARSEAERRPRRSAPRLAELALLWLISLDVHQQIFFQPSFPLLEPLNFLFQTIEALDDVAILVTERVEACVCRH